MNRKDEHLRKLATDLAASNAAIDNTPFGLGVKGQIVVMANDHELQHGGSHFDYREGYPCGPYFDYVELYVLCGNEIYKVYRIIPKPDGSGKGEVIEGGVVESKIQECVRVHMTHVKPGFTLQEAGVRLVAHILKDRVCLGCGLFKPKTSNCKERMNNGGYPD